MIQHIVTVLISAWGYSAKLWGRIFLDARIPCTNDKKSDQRIEEEHIRADSANWNVGMVSACWFKSDYMMKKSTVV